MAARRGKSQDLSSREDYLIAQFQNFRDINKLAIKMFDCYYIDSEPSQDLSPMMRTVVPALWVDPNNPEYPGMYVLAGHSTVSFLERMIFITPYVNDKGKYINDLSAYKGLLINAAEFYGKTKAYRKTSLEPIVVVSDGILGEHTPQSVILRESRTKRKDEMVIPVMQLPAKSTENMALYTEILEKSVYSPFYRYLHKYLGRDNLRYMKLRPEVIDEIKDNGRADIVFSEDRVLSLSKDVMPALSPKNRYSVCFVQDADVPPESGKFHVILKEETLNERGNSTITILTLMAAIAKKHGKTTA